jgi:hypothetical protein
MRESIYPCLSPTGFSGPGSIGAANLVSSNRKVLSLSSCALADRLHFGDFVCRIWPDHLE